MTAQWILNDIWNEGFEDGRRDEYYNVYTVNDDEGCSYSEGFRAGIRSCLRSQGKHAEVTS